MSLTLRGDTPVRVEVKGTMKYLGLLLDSRWRFDAHFDRLAARVRGEVGMFSRLLPNIGGPLDKCRRLYLAVVQSIVTYGAPVWYSHLGASRRHREKLGGIQRQMALRAARGYCTVALEAARVVAGSLPWDLAAEAQALLYYWRQGLRQEEGRPPAPQAVIAQKRHLRQRALGIWQQRLLDCRAGARAVGAIRPVLADWVDRRHGRVTYHLMQVLTGHGCFGDYLHRMVQREPTTECHECGAAEDTAQHTLEFCSAFDMLRRSLQEVVSHDLSLPAIVVKMVGDEEAWSAMVSFCDAVMSQKEAAERDREADPASHPMRRRRGGARRRTVFQISKFSAKYQADVRSD
ncbi:PREDICTED: uncharacterized protein LOC105556415 [Vollenhovia emeryi]|uniref:uncharacterized protein LOC105556415 n=1 Tax=Vollenhovia emeryi TaxID=411798 RepID=UPI0005F3C889|nr:PREDICTED: uncharacterized protein LOC105556415 [Vollenhovia emeryi]